MEQMKTITHKGKSIIVTPTQAKTLQARAEREAAATVTRQVGSHAGDAAKDAFHTAVSVSTTAALVAAAAAVVTSDAMASGSRAIANQCNKVSVNLAGWILAR